MQKPHGDVGAHTSGPGSRAGVHQGPPTGQYKAWAPWRDDAPLRGAAWEMGSGDAEKAIWCIPTTWRSRPDRTGLASTAMHQSCHKTRTRGVDNGGTRGVGDGADGERPPTCDDPLDRRDRTSRRQHQVGPLTTGDAPRALTLLCADAALASYGGAG